MAGDMPEKILRDSRSKNNSNDNESIVMRLLLMPVAICAAIAAWAECAQTGQSPHPAIVRIITPERDGASYGSGVLVAVNDTYGLVVTNWHVVRDAAAPVWVVFPDGFRSAANVLKTDRDWDLAALAIWRPSAMPLPIATQAPQLGQRLTIAGYGDGWFRAVSGQCVQYVSPGGNNPYEMIELSAPARNGDSGGPILNDQGEVAGVLFGSAYGQTTGSYCGRLRWFLSSVAGDFQRLPAQQTMIAQQKPAPLVPVPVAAISAQPSSPAVAGSNAPDSTLRQASISATANNRDIAFPSSAMAVKSAAASVPVNPSLSPATWFEQIRNFMAVIGGVAVLIQVLRMAGKFAG
jgi:hypothetical protein